MKIISSLLLAMILSSGLSAQFDILDSGGPILPEQAAYDVKFYDLTLKVMPDDKFIQGKLRMDAQIVHPLDLLVMDLDTLLSVSAITEHQSGRDISRNFYRKDGRIYIPLLTTRQSGEKISVSVEYSGNPRVAPRAPWDGGFTWAKTPSDAHWIATTCQTNGADLWWPCKDHVSDEPDAMALHINVPDPLIAACNGKLVRMDKLPDNTTTYHWNISTTINIYNVALNIAPYKVIEDTYQSIAGDVFPFVFYVLPEDYEKGLVLFEEMKRHVAFFEKYLGPYPFRADKYGVAHTPHLGMEHQTIIAYGAKFNNGSMTGGKDWGFDALHHHELAHEWWGNLVTNADWRDMWIHEGFGTYMQALYMEDQHGMERYHEYMNNMKRFGNVLAVAPKAIKTSQEIYKAPIYNKGAWILHNLRFVIGDDAFFKALRLMCYPSPELEKVTDGSHTRFVSTADFQTLCERLHGKPLDWFFENYLRQPLLPVLTSRIENNVLRLGWKAPVGEEFPMPIEVELNPGEFRIFQIPKEGLEIPLKNNQKPIVDPNNWLIFDKG